MQYTINYTGLGVQPYSKTVNYGEVVEYPYGTPVYSDAANVYYWFKKWDKSGYANADKTITAEYDTCSYRDNYFKEKDLKELTPVELYMLTQTAGNYFQLNNDTNYLSQKEITIPFGNDFEFNSTDVNSKILVESPLNLTGSNRLDTNEILLDGKKDFVLAVDFERGTNDNATIFQCYNTSSGTGFRVNCLTNSTELVWNEKTITLEKNGKFDREMIVLRHNAGDNFIDLYFSQKNEKEILYARVEALQEPTDTLSLVFGCRKNSANAYSNYAKGTIYWSKLWFADLGDLVCRELAAWPHENLVFTTCSIAGESANYGSGTITFIAKNLLNRPQKMLENNSDAYSGWNNFALAKYLNNRIYNGISAQYKNLIKLAKVPTTHRTEANGEITVKGFDTHLFLPALKEVTSGFWDIAWQSPEAYANEAEGTLDNFALASYLPCKTPDGTPRKYWLRSASFYLGTGFCTVNSDGNINTGEYGTNAETYVRPMFTI